MGEFNFKLDQMSDTNFSLTFYQDLERTQTEDVSTWDFKSQIRERVDDKSFIDELTVANGRIDMSDSVNGKIFLKYPGAISKKYNFSTAYTDLFAIKPGDIPKKIFKGKIELDRAVTR